MSLHEFNIKLFLISVEHCLSFNTVFYFIPKQSMHCLLPIAINGALTRGTKMVFSKLGESQVHQIAEKASAF